MRYTNLDLVRQEDGTYKLKTKSVSTRKKPEHWEHKEQVKVIKWATAWSRLYPDLKWLNPSLSGIFINNKLAAYRAKAAGLKKGYPDLFLPCKKGIYCGLFIELKIKGNKPSAEQKEWINHLNSQGYKAVVAYEALEAQKILEEYLSL